MTWEISPALAALASERAREERAPIRYQIRVERIEGKEAATKAKASAAGDNETALKILSDLIEVHPEFTEAWNRRATVYYLMGRYPESLADIDQVLKREPRHFGALSGLGMIKQKLGDFSAARAAYDDALAVNPNMDGVKRALDQIDRQERPL